MRIHIYICIFSIIFLYMCVKENTPNTKSTYELSQCLFENNILYISTNRTDKYSNKYLDKNDIKIITTFLVKQDALNKAQNYLNAHNDILNYKLDKKTTYFSFWGILPYKVKNEVFSSTADNISIEQEIVFSVDIKLLKNRVDKLKRDFGFKKSLEYDYKRELMILKEIGKFIHKKPVDKYKGSIKKVVNKIKATNLFIDAYFSDKEDLKFNYCKEAIELDPKYASAYGFLGFIPSRFHGSEMAIENLNKAIEIYPNNPQFYILRAQIYDRYFNYRPSKNNTLLIINDLNTAIKICNDAINANPKDAAIYYYRGGIHEKLSNDKMAVKDYNMAFFLNPEYPEAVFQQGVMQTDIEKALMLFTKVIDLDSSFANAYKRRAMIFDYLNNKKSAADDYIAFVKLNYKDGKYSGYLLENPVKLFFDWAIDYLKNNEKGEAEYFFKKSIEVNKWIEDDYLLLDLLIEWGHLMEVQNNYEKASELYKYAEKICLKINDTEKLQFVHDLLKNISNK